MSALYQAVIGGLGGAAGFPSAGLLSKTVALFLPTAGGYAFTTHDGSTEAVANADRVGRIEPYIGTGGNFTQETADSRLYFGVSGAEKWLYAAGNDDHLISTAAEYKISGDLSIVGWIKTLANDTYGFVIGSMEAAGDNNLYEFRVSNAAEPRVQIVQASHVPTVTTTTGSATTQIGNAVDAQIAMIRDVSEQEIRIVRVKTGASDSETIAYSLDLSSVVATATYILGRPDAGVGGIARLYGVGVFNALLTDEDLAELNAEVEAVTGISFT